MYLQLYHGRHALDEDMDGWGFDGPLFYIPDELGGVTMTYASEIQFEFAKDQFGLLHIDDDCVYYDGAWYGDWTFFSDVYFKAQYVVADQTVYDESKSNPPGQVDTFKPAPRPVPLQQVQTRMLKLGKKRHARMA